MSQTRMVAAQKEADEFLDSLLSPPEEEAPGGIAPQEEEQPREEKAPEESIDTLKLEIARLKSQVGDDNSNSWRAKYTTLQGMFNRLNDEMKELKEQVREQRKAPETPATPSMDEKLYKQLVETFGSEDADAISQLIESKAEQIAAKKLAEQLKTYHERIDRVEKTQVETKEQGFFAALTNAIPDWKKINGWQPDGIAQQPEFGDFLDTTVPATDYTYNDLLQYHCQTGNAAKAAEIFNIFKVTQGITAESKPKPSGVEKYVDPGKTNKGTAAPDSTQKKTYSRVEIERFYDSVTKGTFRGTLQERATLEAEYHQAIIEGRVK